MLKGSDTMYCRSHELRVQLCQEFDIKPIGRFKLLNGKIVVSDAGNKDITDEYVIFDCISKTNPNITDTIHCGVSVARDFCQLTGYSLPPLFDPLHHEGIAHNGDVNTSNRPKWNPVRKQLYDIVLLIMTYQGNISKNSVLFEIKFKLEDPDYLAYYPKNQIKSVNTYLNKMGKTFQNILDELSENNHLRNFNYDLVLDYMLKNKLEQHLV